MAEPSVRVFAFAGLAGRPALRWYDVPDTQETRDRITAGLWSLTDSKGLPAPDVIPQRCCGG